MLAALVVGPRTIVPLVMVALIVVLIVLLARAKRR